MVRYTLGAAGWLLLALAGCHSQPTIQRGNASTEAQLAAINSQTGTTEREDGIDAAMKPTVGQRMNGEPQPAKKQ